MKQLALLLALLCTIATASAVEITVPAGTTVYAELDQKVTSKKRAFAVGDIVDARVWRDVQIDGRTVFEAGAPMTVRISDLQHKRIAGRKGDIELEAVSVQAVNGQTINLDGGYDKKGKHRMALAASLAFFVAWPTIFLKGKDAVLEPGTVFDAEVEGNQRLVLEGVSAATQLRLGDGPQTDVSAEVLYDRMGEKERNLPLAITSCQVDLQPPRVLTVNDQSIEAIDAEVQNTRESDGCSEYAATVDLKVLGKHFTKGINRFEIGSAGHVAEVVLDVEL
ncbi:MAG: hypothetical protein AAF184_14350 [Pseudomonadota bacterium]